MCCVLAIIRVRIVEGMNRCKQFALHDLILIRDGVVWNRSHVGKGLNMLLQVDEMHRRIAAVFAIQINFQLLTVFSRHVQALSLRVTAEFMSSTLPSAVVDAL